jgi:hypothetical protein
MRRSILSALVAVGGLSGAHAAYAQSAEPYVTSPAVEAEVAPQAASPYGATYIPGVGFRYVVPGGPRVYGYRAYGPRVHGYRRAYREERCFWLWDDCGRWRR